MNDPLRVLLVLLGEEEDGVCLKLNKGDVGETDRDIVARDDLTGRRDVGDDEREANDD